jgi:hypothetical protein
MRKLNNKCGVTEVLSTVLLLFIASSVMSMVYFQYFTDNGPNSQVHVDIVGEIIKANVTLTHTGGEALAVEDDISFAIGGEEYQYAIGELLIDDNNNGKWDFSEQVIFKDFDINLSRIDQYEYVDVMCIDRISDSLAFNGVISTQYESDIGLYMFIDNLSPDIWDTINITLSAWCYGGDVPGAGNVSINCTLPDGLVYLESNADKGSYDNESGIWNLGNLLVEESPINLTIKAYLKGIPDHLQTQFAIIFEGSDYMSGSVSVWQNTYLNGFRFALEDETIFPHDGSIELTVITCGGLDPSATVEIAPIVITESNYKKIGSSLRNIAYPGGHAPLSSAIRLATDQFIKADGFSSEKRQKILIVTSGNPDSIWDYKTDGGYGGIYIGPTEKVKVDTINAVKYFKDMIDFNEESDELDAITVAKSPTLRNSVLLNESIVIPKPGSIFNISNPIVNPGWVFEVEPGKAEFQEAINLIIEFLLNSIRFRATVVDSTTFDVNYKNDGNIIDIVPSFSITSTDKVKV